MKDSIKKVIQMGGTISLPYKTEISCWYSEIKIHKYNKSYIISPNYIEFFDIDDAVNYFCSESMSSKNYGYVQGRLVKKGIIGDQSECDIENPDEKLIEIFKEEGKIVDEEFKLMNIEVKPFPTIDEANEDIEKIIAEYTNIDSLKKLLNDFMNKYSMIGARLSFSAKYKYDNNNKDYRISFTDLDEKLILKYKDNIKDFNTPMEFICIELCVSISGDYKRFNLNI